MNILGDQQRQSVIDTANKIFTSYLRITLQLLKPDSVYLNVHAYCIHRIVQFDLNKISPLTKP